MPNRASRYQIILFICLLVLGSLSSNLLNRVYAQTPFVTDNSATILIPQEGPLLYDREYPMMGYSTRLPTDPVAQLHEKFSNAELSLKYDPQHGYLNDLLAVLDIDPESQVLVYSDTSLNVGLIRANNPRAIYFNDETYIAWVPESDAIEIATMDPDLGPVFYVLHQTQDNNPGPIRHNGLCLRCHDSLTMSGGGVPRFIVGSGYTSFTGALVSHEGWILTKQETPLRFRWGGWYVTGEHGNQVHLGNIVVGKPEELQDLESIRKGNLENIASFINPENYLTNYSDIDALMVMEHQIQIQNLITRVNYDVRKALFENAMKNGATKAGITDTELDTINAIIEPLIMAMLMVDEAEITAPIMGNSGFRAKFENRGKLDSKGRSLRMLDLNTRMFHYPLSYLIYSRAFDALPDIARGYVYERLNQVLSGEDDSELFSHLDEKDRKAIKEILSETKPEFLKMTDPN
jgi:hypothetical protein